MSRTISVHCFSCGTKMQVTGVGFRDDCEKCGSDLHVCKNCQFYDPGSYNECREPSAEVVREKERANFCEYFQAKGDGISTGPSKDDLLSAAEALFKKK